MSFYGWKPYVSVAERRRKAEKAAAKAKKAGAQLSPVDAYRGAIAKTFWGKAWSDNLERYGDYANRLPRGRTYVRNGSVIDLKIARGEVQAQVIGSSLYKIAVKISAVPVKHWRAISADCAGSIDTLVELLQGRLSKAVMERICMPATGLFPSPKEIQFTCSCPDWASMCKHVAAVLYGVGARLDQQPELMFMLRGVDAKELVTQAGAGLAKSRKGPGTGKVLDDALLGDVFGIEMAELTPETKPIPPRPKKTGSDASEKVIKKPAKVPSSRKLAVTKKVIAVKKPVKAKTLEKSSARPSKSAIGKPANGGKKVAKVPKIKKAGPASGSSAKGRPR